MLLVHVSLRRLWVSHQASGVPQCSDVYFRWRQSVPARTAATVTRPNLRRTAEWTPELRPRRRSQTPDWPSACSQRRRGRGCAYEEGGRDGRFTTRHQSRGGRRREGRNHNGKHSWQRWHLHQGDGLPAADALLVDENQDADDGAHQAEAPHQAGDDERRVHRHGHQLAAALAVVVPVFTHRASGEDVQRRTSSPQRKQRSNFPVSTSYSCSWEFSWGTFDLNINIRIWGNTVSYITTLEVAKSWRDIRSAEFLIYK